LQGAPEDRLGLGITPLLYAVRQNNLAVIALLLRYGANPNVHVGLTTALREARRLGNQEAVQMLLAAGGADFQDLLRAPLILPLNFGLPGVR
jgi:ankyrin repeat protein